MEHREKLGEILIKAGLISEIQLRSGLAYQRQWGTQLGEALISLGFISEVELLKILAQQLQIPAVNLAKTFVSDETLKIISPNFAQRHAIIPLGKKTSKGQEVLLVATSDPTNLSLLDEIKFMINLPVRFVVATRSSIIKAINKFYFKEKVDFSQTDESLVAKLNKMNEGDLVLTKDDSASVFQIDLAQTAPEPKQESKQQPTLLQQQATLASKSGVSREFQALLKLLIKKGLITRTEYINELKKM
ncbi:hypothetical protein JXQ70_12905 [bacterium]|nr:hypothetical protein [bacterium]